MDEAFVKQITGGDGVNSRGNYSREGNKRWQPECLVMMATNHLMRISFDDEALWSRIRIVPWKIAFPLGHRDRDEKLADKIIANELAGVISWAVQGLKLYRSEGLDDIPPEVREATEKYKGQSDHVSTWLRHAIGSDDVREKAAGFSRISDLHAIASQWAKAAKVRDFPGIGAFNRRLQDLGYVFGPLPAKHIGKQQMKNSRVLQGLQVPAESISRHGIKE
jgi:putative DNA primase/helicase